MNDGAGFYVLRNVLVRRATTLANALRAEGGGRLPLLLILSLFIGTLDLKVLLFAVISLTSGDLTV